MPTILVTGANRGLGLEFVRQYAQRGWRVLATARDLEAAEDLKSLAIQHPEVVLAALDVCDEAAIGALSRSWRDERIDVLLNNAGWLGDRDQQSLQVLDYATFAEVLKINTFAPLVMAKEFLPQVLASEQKKIVVVSSGLSSIANTMKFGNLYFYRISKAGVNMAMRTLQAELREQGVKVGMLAPGMVDTRLLRESGYGGPGVIEAPQSVAAVMSNIDQLDQSAELILYTGERLPW